MILQSKRYLECENIVVGFFCFVLELVCFLFNSLGFLVILPPHSPDIKSTSSAANTVEDFIQWSDAVSSFHNKLGQNLSQHCKYKISRILTLVLVLKSTEALLHT